MTKKFQFSGPIDRTLHYGVHRKDQIEQIYNRLIGDYAKGGEYFSLCSPSQTGKTSIIKEVALQIDRENYHYIFISLESFRDVSDRSLIEGITERIAKQIQERSPQVDTWEAFSMIFHGDTLFFSKPVILIFDQLDALQEKQIVMLYSIMGDIFIQKSLYWLHSLVFIATKNIHAQDYKQQVSPAQINTSYSISNFSTHEVKELFDDYISDTKISIEQSIIEKIYHKFQGQPGLTCWFASILTDYIQKVGKKNIAQEDFFKVYDIAQKRDMHPKIMNLMQLVRDASYMNTILAFFRAVPKEDISIDYNKMYRLYILGILCYFEKDNRNFLSFSCPFLQERIFFGFIHELFGKMHTPVDPFDPLDDVFISDKISIKNLLLRYQDYVEKHLDDFSFDFIDRREEAFEGLYIFHFYKFLKCFFKPYKVELSIDFPSPCDAFHIAFHFFNMQMVMEVRNFQSIHFCDDNVQKAIVYAKKKKLSNLYLVYFVKSDNKVKASRLLNSQYTINGIKVEVITLTFPKENNYDSCR